MQKLARLAIRRRWYVIGAWVAFILITMGISRALGGSADQDVFTLPGTETQAVSDLFAHSGLASQNNLDGLMVMHAKTGPLSASTPPADVITALENSCHVHASISGIVTPWGSIDCAGGATLNPVGANPKLLGTKDPSIGLADISFAGGGTFDQNAATRAYDNLKQLNNPTLQVEFTGDGFQGVGMPNQAIQPEFLGFIAALIILSIVFRTPGAVALPLASAVAALSSGLALIAILSHGISVSSVTQELAELMVIGVGIDYALFIVTRHRRNLLAGMPVADSIVSAINTSGRAVLFAGTTVCIAILGLLALGVNFFYGLAIGTAIAVSLTMLASITLLPALLSFLGLAVLGRKKRRALRAGGYVAPTRVSRWTRWSRLLAHRKAIFGPTALALIVVLAIPFFSMRLGHADQGNDPSDTTTRRGYDLVAQGFGVGYNSTLTLVVSGPNVQTTAEKVAAAMRTTDNVDPASIFVPHEPLKPDLTIVEIKSQSAPQDAATTTLVTRLRNDVLPPIYAGTGDHVYVYGQTAVYVDIGHVLSAKLPLFIGAVVALSFLLLLIAFRSLVIPATAALMNLFAAGASFGVIVAIFQWGWGSEALGIGKGGPVDAFVPALFFAVLFGLSMDYQVFLVSRMHEEWVHTRDNRRAITVGQAETGGIITAAATIMIFVFGGFVLGDNRVVKLVGLGLSSAIFIDAFVLRTVLVPSLMHLFGRANWFFPKWLERITPRVSVEPAEDAWQPGELAGAALASDAPEPDEPVGSR